MATETHPIADADRVPGIHVEAESWSPFTSGALPLSDIGALTIIPDSG